MEDKAKNKCHPRIFIYVFWFLFILFLFLFFRYRYWMSFLLRKMKSISFGWFFIYHFPRYIIRKTKQKLLWFSKRKFSEHVNRNLVVPNRMPYLIAILYLFLWEDHFTRNLLPANIKCLKTCDGVRKNCFDHFFTLNDWNLELFLSNNSAA